jgi:hypothetical protein
VLGHLGTLIAEMLAEGIDAADIRAGLAAWHTRNLHPSTLPSVVHEVMNAPTTATASQGTRRSARSTTDERMAQAQALKAKFRAKRPGPTITGEILQ